ncbi:hypothetical protein Ancab_026734 [Ancistrocladus abbreviatus]
MYELRDEIIIEGNGLPWLIWIQLVVLFLLVLLLYYLGVFYFDFSGAGDSAINSSSSSSLGLFVCGAGDNRIRTENDQVGGSEVVAGERATSISNSIHRAQSISERDGSSTKNVPRSRILKQIYHPCHYLELVRRAFLGCLGLGSAPWNPRAREKEE